MKKYILLICVGLGSVLQSLAQAPAPVTGSIKGIVADSTTQKPFDYVTISLKNAQKQVIKTQVSRADGMFAFEKVPAGKYAISLIHVGYATKTVPVEITAANPQQNLGTLAISPQSKQLSTVSITTDRPVIKQEVDRLSYDLQADPESKVNNVLDMMRKVPMLSVDASDNIKLNGDANYRILINGKPSSMMERSPKDILRSMPASSIQKIEVITTPPAKYDADGLAGIINIITNKKVDNGYNGTLNVNTRFPVGGPGTGGSFNYKQGKFGVSTFAGASLFTNPATTLESNRLSLVGTQRSDLIQSSWRKSDSKSAYFGTELSYELDSLNLISAQFNLNGNRSNGESNQETSFTSTGNTAQRYSLANTNKGIGNGMDAAFNYQKGFKNNKSRLLTFSYRYFGFGNDQTNNLDLTNYTDPDYRQVNESNAGEHTAQLDYLHPFKKVTMEAGLKAIMRSNESDFQYLTFQNTSGEFITDPSRTNTFNNTQNVFSAYNTYQYNLKAWGFKGGVRMENTVIDADFISNASQVKQNYFNVVPSIAVSRKFKNMSSLNLGISQRIQRPGINQLNPFVDRSNPNFEFTGNPNLRPATGTSIQLGYNWTKKVTISYNVRYNWINSLIFPVSALVPGTSITRTRFENTGKAQMLGNNLNVNYPFTNTWAMTFNGNLAYGHVIGTNNGSPIENDGVLYNLNLSTNKRFEKGWRVTMGVGFNSGDLTIQERSNRFATSSFTVTKDVVKDKLSFSANAANPFTKYRINHTHTFGPGFNQNNFSQQYFRTGNVSLNYRFGKLKETIKKNKRGITNDDVSN